MSDFTRARVEMRTASLASPPSARVIKGPQAACRVPRARTKGQPRSAKASNADVDGDVLLSTSTTPTTPTSSSLSCPHFDECSGCTLSEGLSTPPAFREASAWFERHGIELKERRDDRIHGWRCRARLAVRREKDSPSPSSTAAVAIGLFRAGTHDVSPIPRCVAHHPRINDAAEAVRSAVERLGTRVYSDLAAREEGGGGLRYLQLTAVSPLLVSSDDDHDDGDDDDDEIQVTKTPIDEDLNAQIQLVLVWGSDGSEPRARREAEELASALWEGDDHERGGGGEGEGRGKRKGAKKLFHSIFHNWQPSPGNAVMGPRYERFAGPEVAWQRISVAVGGGGAGGGNRSTSTSTSSQTATTATVAVALSPAAFSQANPSAFGSLVGELAQLWILPDEEGGKISAVADLHAGAGAVGLSLAAAAAAAAAADERHSPSLPSPSLSSSRSPLASLERIVAVDCVGAGRVPLAASATLFRREKQQQQEEQQEQQRERRGGSQQQRKTTAAISVAFHEARASDDPARWLRGADAAVVDPPRKGLLRGDPELLRMLSENPPKGLRRFAYISCHFPSLARDAEVLLLDDDNDDDDDKNQAQEKKRPFWRLSHGAARIFFPGADHVECLAVFERIEE